MYELSIKYKSEITQILTNKSNLHQTHHYLPTLVNIKQTFIHIKDNKEDIREDTQGRRIFNFFKVQINITNKYLLPILYLKYLK